MASAKANSSLPKLVSHRPDTTGGDDGPLKLDVAALRERLRRRNEQYGSLRVHTATFRAPWPIRREQYEKVRNLALDKWLRVQEQRGYVLHGKPQITGPYEAFGTSGDWYTVPLGDQREYRVRALFSTDAKPVRMEVVVEQP